MAELYLYDFGIFIELEPDEEEKALLENNIQTALSQQLIDLDDAIDIREVRSLKLANQLLKIKRKKKQEREQQIQQENMQAQAQANAQAQQAAAQTEMQKNQAKTQSDIELESAKTEMKLKYLQEEVRQKMQLMDHEFALNQQMQQGQLPEEGRLTDVEKEDRKDERTIKQGSQQKELLQQKQSGGTAKKFESSGNDILGGGLGLDKFAPKIGT